MTQKFCKDCKHYKAPGKYLTHHRCHSPENEVDPVTGEPEATLCTYTRIVEDRCGPDGKWWEPKCPLPPPNRDYNDGGFVRWIANLAQKLLRR